MKTYSCLKCGYAERTHGKIYQTRILNDVRFKADEAFGLSLKERVFALRDFKGSSLSNYAEPPSRCARMPLGIGPPICISLPQRHKTIKRIMSDVSHTAGGREQGFGRDFEN